MALGHVTYQTVPLGAYDNPVQLKLHAALRPVVHSPPPGGQANVTWPVTCTHRAPK